MKFSIRDLLLVTMIVALALGWWLDRSRLASREREAVTESESYQALSESLTHQLQDKNPTASIEISVNGQGVLTSREYADPSEVVIKVVKKPIPSMPASVQRKKKADIDR